MQIARNVRKLDFHGLLSACISRYDVNVNLLLPKRLTFSFETYLKMRCYKTNTSINMGSRNPPLPLSLSLYPLGVRHLMFRDLYMVAGT